ncbi:YpiF family protein [Mesobacillus harenae]|uniref:YpiF family protein n=1 Tax=Mesobacillus harenae TaxID=2213203 RepID=UPI00158096AD|nr:YpiF family protein [Mesobacillus harenae]
MRWTSSDMDMYMKEKEYVDTAVIPMLPVSFGSDMKQAASMAEFIALLTNQLERQFRGRLVLLPGYTYFKNDSEKSLEGVKNWERELGKDQFKHVFIVTADTEWKKHERNLSSSLIWLPSIPLEHMDENYKVSIIEDQVKQLMHLFIQKWRESE